MYGDVILHNAYKMAKSEPDYCFKNEQNFPKDMRYLCPRHDLDQAGALIWRIKIVF